MIKRLTQFRISRRLPTMITVMLLVSLSMTLGLILKEIRDNMVASTLHRAEVVAEEAKARFEAWRHGAEGQLHTLAENVSVKDALVEMSRALQVTTSADIGVLRSAYVDGSPFPVGERNALRSADDGSIYSALHSDYHPFFNEVIEQTGFYDLFLINTSGRIVYSVFKENDFLGELNRGPLADSSLAEAFRGAIVDNSEMVLADFAPYAPSNGAQAAFIAHGLHDENGTLIGAVAIQVPLKMMMRAIENETVLNVAAGDSAYILGSDGKYRTSSYVGDLFSVGETAPDAPHIADAVNGKDAVFDGAPGIAGAPAIVAVTPVDAFGQTWSIVVELNREIALAPMETLLWYSLILGVSILLGSVLVGVLIARSITSPLALFSGEMSRIADGDFGHEVEGSDRHDEIGGLARILEDFRQKLAHAKEEESRQAVAQAEQQRVVGELARGLKDLADGNLIPRLNSPFGQEYEGLRVHFNTTLDTLSDLVGSISGNAREIQSRSQELTLSSDNLAHRTENQAATLEETAAALDELTASVRSAADSATEVERVVNDAQADGDRSKTVVADAVSAMSSIKKSSDEISQIISVIDDIAFQTNLLALNAGVEAARAGDAGRGFAVVASEVRGLAQRSSDAAKQIKSLIGESQEQVETGVNLVGMAGDALTSIVDRVRQIAELMTGIATGSREQSAGLGEINVGVAQLDQVTQQNAAMVEESTAAAATLKNEAEALNDLVSRFQIDRGPTARSAEVVDMPKFSRPASRGNVGSDGPDRVRFAAANSGKWQDF